MRRGEVWWVEDPPVGRRPHLILTRDSAIPVLNALITIPVTRTVRGLPTEVLLGVDDGMPGESVLSLDNLASVPKVYVRERMCTLGPEKMHRVCRALELATGCRAA